MRGGRDLCARGPHDSIHLGTDSQRAHIRRCRPGCVSRQPVLKSVKYEPAWLYEPAHSLELQLGAIVLLHLQRVLLLLALYEQAPPGVQEGSSHVATRERAG